MQRILFTWAILGIAALAPAAAWGGDKEDRAAAEQIATILRDSGNLQSYSVGVKYKNGTVWLTGRVTSKQQMQAALQVVSDIEGIEQIVNNLEVAPAKQTAAGKASGKATARRVSATSADMEGETAASAAAPTTDADVKAAGYHHLKHAARHAPPVPYMPGPGAVNPPAYDQPHMPGHAWPSYAAYPNYAAVSYPKQYSPTAFPYIGPFYPYPQVPLGWRKVALEWDDGWWFLDFYDRSHH